MTPEQIRIARQKLNKMYFVGFVSGALFVFVIIYTFVIFRGSWE